LPPLSWSETRDMVDALELPGDRPAAATAVHAFTGGHPGATSALLAAMADHPAGPGDPRVQPGAHPEPSGALAVLRQPVAGRLCDDPETVEAALLNGLLAGAPKAIEDLTTCAAARGNEAAERMAVAADCDLMEHLLREEPAIFSTELWSADSAGGPPVMQPLLRRLLLRRLADRPPGEPASWTSVHEWLGGKHRGAGTGIAAQGRAAAGNEGVSEIVGLYHALAIGDVERVARVLAERLAVTDAGEWLRLLTLITAAPNRVDRGQDPRDQVLALTAWADPREHPVAPVARLVAYSWLGADPISAPHWRWLLRQMAIELDQIAPLSVGAGITLLRGEAQRCRDIADADTKWSEVEEFWMTRAAEL
jgi:hypothetical protein